MICSMYYEMEIEFYAGLPIYLDDSIYEASDHFYNYFHLKIYFMTTFGLYLI